MTEYSFKQANIRYRRMVWPVMLGYCVLCFAGPLLLWLMRPPSAWILGAVALLTAAPIAGVFWLMGRLLKETDEYSRAMQTQAMLTSGAITLSLAIAWSFLELYQVAPRSKFFPSMMLVGPCFFFVYGVALGLHRLRNRTPA